MPYFYKPLSLFNGKILKCAGICDESNALWFTAQNPGVVIVDVYRGDRISADTLKPIA